MARGKRIKVRKPKSLDEKYLGYEPSFESGTTVSNAELIKNLNWYNYFYDNDRAIRFLKDHLKKTANPLLKQLGNIPDYELRTAGWVVRMVDNGANLGASYTKIMEKLAGLVSKYHKPKEKAVVRQGPSIQDRVKAKTDSLIVELENYADKIMIGEEVDIDTYKWMLANDVKQVNANSIYNYYVSWASELASDKTADTKLVQFITGVVEDAKRIAINQKRTRRPRKTKVKSVDQIINRLKFKKEDADYKLKSIDPVSIVGAKELWVFNTKYKVLSVYRSETGLSVKGTTLQNWDEKTSEGKRLRKPDLVLKSVINGTKSSMKRIMPELKTKTLNLTGRINGDTILVKTY